MSQKWLWDITNVIHSNEGLLIFLVLFVWHIYDVHLSPGVFPMSKVWLNGKMSKEDLKKKPYIRIRKTIRERKKMQQNNYLKNIIKIRYFITVALTAFFVIGFITYYNTAKNAQFQDQKCLTCHGKKDMKVQLEDGSYRALYVNTESLSLSPHKDRSCQDCHADIVEITALGHKKNVKKVQCTRCHFENNPVGAPETEKYREFQESVHQQEFLKGNTKAPMCQNCHGSHDIKSRNSISKLELKKKMTKVCGQCHLDIYTAYKTSIHGSALFDKGVEDVPACYDCHGEHKIKKIDDPASTVYKTQIYTTCGACHASGKYCRKIRYKSR